MSNNKSLWYGLLLAWILTSTYWHVCKVKKLCDTDLIASWNSNPSQPYPKETFEISDSSALVLKSAGNFAFAKNGIYANNTGVYSELDSLVRYLTIFRDKRLTITGSYSPQENNTTIYADLGLARAGNVKNWLLTRGISDSHISIKSRQEENIRFLNDSLIGGIELTFDRKTVTPTPEPKIVNIFKPLQLYFTKASAAYTQTPQNEIYILEAKKYLAENTGKKLIVTGHTDDEDSAEWNLILSRKRASAVKRQLIATGIPAEKIIAIGKGESEPIASNETSEGKFTNRRVTIVVE